MAEIEALQINGELSYDPSEVYFYGISNGHILGMHYPWISGPVTVEKNGETTGIRTGSDHKMKFDGGTMAIHKQLDLMCSLLSNNQITVTHNTKLRTNSKGKIRPRSA